MSEIDLALHCLGITQPIQIPKTPVSEVAIVLEKSPIVTQPTLRDILKEFLKVKRDRINKEIATKLIG